MGELFFAETKIFSVEDKKILETQGYTSALEYFYDSSKNTIWGCSSNRKTDTVLLFDTFDSDFIKKSLTISFEKAPFICGISNNKLLNCINSSNKQYEIVLIPDLNRVKFEIKTDELILLPIGFCDDRIFLMKDSMILERMNLSRMKLI